VNYPDNCTCCPDYRYHFRSRTGQADNVAKCGERRILQFAARVAKLYDLFSDDGYQGVSRRSPPSCDLNEVQSTSSQFCAWQTLHSAFDTTYLVQLLLQALSEHIGADDQHPSSAQRILFWHAGITHPKWLDRISRRLQPTIVTPQTWHRKRREVAQNM
jgi:hypothetical protein